MLVLDNDYLGAKKPETAGLSIKLLEYLDSYLISAIFLELRSEINQHFKHLSLLSHKVFEDLNMWGISLARHFYIETKVYIKFVLLRRLC